MATGTVKFFKEDKAYGFIVDKESGKDVFVHASGLRDKVAKNDEVSFDTEEGKKGPNAINVKRIG